MEKYNWLKKLKPMDAVIVGENVETVKRIDGGCIILFGGRRFSTADGCYIGHYVLDPDYLEEATPERIEKIRERIKRNCAIKSINDLLDVYSDKLSIYKLNRIAEKIRNECFSAMFSHQEKK